MNTAAERKSHAPRDLCSHHRERYDRAHRAGVTRFLTVYAALCRTARSPLCSWPHESGR